MDRLAEINKRAQEMDRAFDFLRAIQIRAKHWNNANAARAEAEGEYGAYSRIYSLVTRGAVAGADTSNTDGIVSDYSAARAWMSILSTRTLAGRIPFPRVPFRTKTLTESAAGSAEWVAEGAPIPVSKLSLAATALDRHKISGIFAVSDEVLKIGNQENLARLNQGMLAVISRYQDRAMLDPDFAAVSQKNPASLTNGIDPIESTGSSESAVTANIKTMLQSHTSAGADLNDIVIAMHPTTALHLSTLLTAGNIRAFPNLGVRGGEIFGVPVLTSVGATCSGSPSERVIAAINPMGCLLSDEGEIEITPTKKAAIQLLDNPTNNQDGTASAVVALFQTDATALRFSRWISFARALSGAVSYMRVAY